MPEISKLENNAYNALRAKELKYETQLLKVWKDALNTIRFKMAFIYEKYSKDGLLSKAEMTKYNRYITLEKDLMALTNETVNITKDQIKRLRPELYNESFFRYAWTIDNSEGIRVNWGLLNKDAILENLDNEFYKISLVKYGENARTLIKTAINKQFIVGKSYAAMVKDLKKSINSTAYEALRILRTEGQTAINAGQADAYTRAEQEGIEGDRIWDSTLDGKTRPTHRVMDQQVRGIDSYKGPGEENALYPAWEGLSAGERIQCRCHERFQVKGLPDPIIRRSRENGVIPYQSYTQWSEGRKLWQ